MPTSERNTDMNYFRKKTEAYWQESAGQREAMAQSALHFYEKRINLKSARVLEIGCGTGDFSMMLARAGASVVALEISQQRIDALRKRSEGKGLTLDFVKGDAQSTTFGDETFDFILCRNVIEHVSNPSKLISEMARILKPGCAIQITAPNRYSLSQLFRDEHFRLPLVVVLPRRVAAFIVCGLFNLEDDYSVSFIPSYRMLRRWITASGLTAKMDLPDRELIQGKWTQPEKVNNRFIRFVVRFLKLMGMNRMIADIASSERFLGFFSPRWSLWVSKPEAQELPES